MEKADIGLVGLAVMGENLILNMESRGYTVAVFNRTVEKVDKFMAGRAKGKKIIGAHTLQELVASLKAPRKVMLMVKAGAAVDEFIDHLTPLLSKGDIIIDGGNSHFPDTIRRTKALEAKGLLYIGTGVSGGEEGALKGPSIMPGGSPAAWPAVKPIFQAIAAKVEDGTPCCDWVGNDGAGHFVKMVHNGIEYGDMQLICESYQIMKDLLGMSADEMHEVFAEWNRGDLDSYLIEITRDILAFKDKDGTPLVDKILDTAGQKGTGKWTSVTALDLGIPLTLISEAVYARTLSAGKDARVAASKLLRGPDAQVHRRSQGVRRRHRPRALRLEDHLLRAGLRDDASGGRRVQMGPLLRRDRADVAGRLHHPVEVPGQDQGGVRPGSQAVEPAAGAVLHAEDRGGSGELAAGRGDGGAERDLDPGHRDCAHLLRRVPQRAAAGQPAAGAARLLRRAPVRAHRSAARDSSSTPTGRGGAGIRPRPPTSFEKGP